MTRIGTSIKGEGKVVRRDITIYGLNRMCVECIGKYPDLELWSALIADKQTPRVWQHRYTEKMNVDFHGYLWIYWKE
jgi:hypothetical protein